MLLGFETTTFEILVHAYLCDANAISIIATFNSLMHNVPTWSNFTKILYQKLQDFSSVPYHFGTLCIKGSIRNLTSIGLQQP